MVLISHFSKELNTFLDRNFSHFTLILIVNYMLGSFGLTFSDRYDKNLIVGEIAELFIYLLLLLDTFKKKKLCSKNIENNYKFQKYK